MQGDFIVIRKQVMFDYFYVKFNLWFNCVLIYLYVWLVWKVKRIEGIKLIVSLFFGIYGFQFLVKKFDFWLKGKLL